MYLKVSRFRFGFFCIKVVISTWLNRLQYCRYSVDIISFLMTKWLRSEGACLNFHFNIMPVAIVRIFFKDNGPGAVRSTPMPSTIWLYEERSPKDQWLEFYNNTCDNFAPGCPHISFIFCVIPEYQKGLLLTLLKLIRHQTSQYKNPDHR